MMRGPLGHSKSRIITTLNIFLLLLIQNTFTNTIMYFCLLAAVAGLFFFEEPGWAQDPPQPVRRLIEQASPNARIEYCGAISMKALEYYLFAERAGCRSRTCAERSGEPAHYS
jgi:hypothetical protein